MISLIKAGAQPVSQPPAARASASGSTQHGDRRSRRQACCRERAGNGGTAARRRQDDMRGCFRRSPRLAEHPDDRASTKAAPIAARFLKGTVRCSPCAVCTFAQTRLPFWRGIAPSKGDQHDHDRAGVPRQMPVCRCGGRYGRGSRSQTGALLSCAMNSPITSGLRSASGFHYQNKRAAPLPSLSERVAPLELPRWRALP